MDGYGYQVCLFGDPRCPCDQDHPDEGDFELVLAWVPAGLARMLQNKDDRSGGSGWTSRVADGLLGWAGTLGLGCLLSPLSFLSRPTAGPAVGLFVFSPVCLLFVHTAD